MSRVTFLSLVILVLAALSFSMVSVSGVGGSGSVDKNRISGRPRVMLWAWERPCDLRFLNRENVGVAYLDQTLRLDGKELLRIPRKQRLLLPESCYLEAVTRIEVLSHVPEELQDRQLERLSKFIARTAFRPGVRSVQIDFDASSSMRPFYRKLISKLDRVLPESTELTMTGLASWVIGDPWLKEMRVDRVVPMFFRLGADKRRVISFLKSDKSLRDSGHSLAIGLSVDEPDLFNIFAKTARGGSRTKDREIYLFCPGTWHSESVNRTIRKVI